MRRLPVQEYRKNIVAAVARCRRLILKAPTGTGKSTLVPLFLLEEMRKNAGKVYVLEPRRIAAAGLAWRVSQQLGENIGQSVGYQVRNDSRVSSQTCILFQTYGWFLQRLLRNSGFLESGIVILDEFHERTLEMDAALAWLRLLQEKNGRSFQLIIMSATLDTSLMKAALADAGCLEIPGEAFPVETEYLPPLQGVMPWQQAARAFRRLLGKGITGTVLVFMPGRLEIDKTVESLTPLCRKLGWQLNFLHAGLSLERQGEILNPKGAPVNRVVVATNVAESAVTIPGVRAVIDSGMARMAGYDPEKEVNTLYLKRIAGSNATQRAGRAGRTGPGNCIRMWNPEMESAMQKEPEPEMLRLDLTEIQLRTRCFLKAAELDSGWAGLGQVEWLTPPGRMRWQKAADNLAALGVLDAGGRLNSFAERLARFPVHPKWGAIVLKCRDAGIGSLGAAMVAVASGRLDLGPAPGNLADAGASFMANSSQWHHTIRDTYKRLIAGGRGLAQSREWDTAKTQRLLADIWAGAFPEKMGYRTEGFRYRLTDGRVISLPGQTENAELPEMIVAVNLAETGGAGRSRRLSCCMWVPSRLDWMKELFPDSFLLKRSNHWDSKKARVSATEEIFFNGALLSNKDIYEKTTSMEAEAILVEKLLAGEITLPQWDEKFEQLWLRFQLLSQAYPEYGFPKLNHEDRELFLHGVCENQTSLPGLRKVGLRLILRQYMGETASAMVDRVAPERVQLTSGRTGRYAYFSNAMPELSARLGDFIGMQGEHTICEGRVKVLYNILAPNFRTVQKTKNLSRFWRKTYPEVKKELQRRYPKHPWPDF